MAALKAALHVGPPFSNAIEVRKVTWDFAKDGGAISALDAMTMDENMVILGCFGKVITTCTSDGSALLSLGIDSDADTLIDEVAVASLAAAYFGAPIAAYCPAKIAKNSVIKVNIAGAAMTAGKVEFTVLFMKF
jgi:hypothetical protein